MSSFRELVKRKNKAQNVFRELKLSIIPYPKAVLRIKKQAQM